MSCCGLEEYCQLCIKWGAFVHASLGPGWEPALAALRALPPGRRFSRLHMPAGVGCYGNTYGKTGSSSDAAVAAAARGDARTQPLQAAAAARGEAAAEQVREPDWEALAAGLADVTLAGPGERERARHRLRWAGAAGG